MIIPHNKITFDDAEIKAVNDVIASGHWVGGQVQKNLENKLSRIFGVKGAVCVGSGLSAIRLSLLSLGVGEGDEVILPAYSCVALANAILSVGAIPVPADINSKTFNICPMAVRQVISEKTKTIISVNSFGMPSEILELKEIGIPVIEDCSHGFQIDKNFSPKVIQADIAIFSFYATKLIAGGEGGAILSNSEKVIQFCKSQRDYTDQLPDRNRLNDKMTDIEAALVEVQLSKLSKFLQIRSEIANNYSDEFKDNDYFYTPEFSKRRVWYRYILCLKDDIDPDLFIEKLENDNVAIRKPIENWLEDKIESYPNAKKAYEKIISIPLYPLLTLQEQKYVIDKLMKALSNE